MIRSRAKVILDQLEHSRVVRKWTRRFLLEQTGSVDQVDNRFWTLNAELLERWKLGRTKIFFCFTNSRRVDQKVFERCFSDFRSTDEENIYLIPSKIVENLVSTGQWWCVTT